MIGQLNRVVQASKFKRLHKKYLEEKEQRLQEQSENLVPADPTPQPIPFPTVDQRIVPNVHEANRRRYSDYYRVPEQPEFSNVTIIDSDLIMVPAHSTERQLIANAGLKVESEYRVQIIKDRKGNMKSALGIRFDENGSVSDIRFIDVDSDGEHFKKALVKLATMPNGISFKSSKIEVNRDEIREDLIIPD